MKGKGLNSIPIRFAVMTGVMTTLCVAAQFYLWIGVGYQQAAPGLIAAIMISAIVIPTVITWAAAAKLTGQIRALRVSTEAIVAGDFDSPVDVDCACEVGGLADSFRKMVGRLNSNILRMNILAYSDALTGLPNRIVATHMLDHLTQAGSRGQGAVLFIDLDGFKQVNDTHGHEAGDELLRQASLRIIEKGLGRTPEQLDTCTTPYGELCERAPEDIVFVRFAGDEFVALLPDVTDLDTLKAIAERIVSSLEAPFNIKGNSITIGASIGIARTPIDSSHPGELLNFADIAMYAAKEAGKNGFRFFDHSMRDLVVERNRIEADLRQAIAGDELTLHYQPKLDAATLECVGIEALARWNHPTRGMIAPGTFISIAEQGGLMPVMGASILRIAIRQCRA
jgi:predicted signal transduction protein with EAL and GGDEF domain